MTRLSKTAPECGDTTGASGTSFVTKMKKISQLIQIILLKLLQTYVHKLKPSLKLLICFPPVYY